MTALQLGWLPARGVDAAGEFEVGYLTGDGAEQRVTRFEDGLPVRRFTPHKGQRRLNGLWWSATMDRHVGFESWLERDHGMLLDFDGTWSASRSTVLVALARRRVG